jgi:hypothetical protein
MSSPARVPRSRFADGALVVLFLTAISAPLIGSMLGLDFGRLKENRTRAPRPELKLQRQELAEFPGRFEAYFNDSFGFRDQLIRWNNRAKVSLLGISTSSLVMIGKRGWLFFLYDHAIDDLRRTHPLTRKQLAQWAKTLEERREWLAQRGIHYVFMFAPNKHSIYPEYVTGKYKHATRPTRYDQFIRYMRDHTQVEIVDLRAPLLKAKADDERLYFRRDTHWNDRGAFVGYQTIMETLARWDPQLRPRPRSEFRTTRLVWSNPDLAVMLGLGEEMPDRDFRLEPRSGWRAHPAKLEPGVTADPSHLPEPIARECDNPELPRAVIFRDSFSIFLIPFLSEHFARSLYLWHCTFDPVIIERERPQVVIEEYIERRLWGPPPVSGLAESMIARK